MPAFCRRAPDPIPKGESHPYHARYRFMGKIGPGRDFQDRQPAHLFALALHNVYGTQCTRLRWCV
jgi:hypothetical protein